MDTQDILGFENAHVVVEILRPLVVSRLDDRETLICKTGDKVRMDGPGAKRLMEVGGAPWSTSVTIDVTDL